MSSIVLSVRSQSTARTVVRSVHLSQCNYTVHRCCCSVLPMIDYHSNTIPELQQPCQALMPLTDSRNREACLSAKFLYLQIPVDDWSLCPWTSEDMRCVRRCCLAKSATEPNPWRLDWSYIVLRTRPRPTVTRALWKFNWPRSNIFFRGYLKLEDDDSQYT